ncbi:hypothetical protein [Beihai hepe-like virus 4]|uniref:hypothetical protein n=1 Tax=Beihai hepe-like virus 4 TaxID=1922387 RepID=UPI00090C438B|nr:hypothetical protein [Beihai hepe-like virus 4]APG77599.1 hypothetical protein [Beihai hepe-like virus 4]
MAERTAFETMCRRGGIDIPEVTISSPGIFSKQVTDKISTLQVHAEDFVASIVYNGDIYYGVGSRKKLATNQLFCRLMGSPHVKRIKAKEGLLSMCKDLGIACHITYHCNKHESNAHVDLQYNDESIFTFVLDDVRFHNVLHEATEMFNSNKELVLSRFERMKTDKSPMEVLSMMTNLTV